MFHKNLVLPTIGRTKLSLATVGFLLRLEKHLVFQFVALVVGSENVVFIALLETCHNFLEFIIFRGVL